MPQEIRVLKCFKCDMFQGDIVKKVKIWQCKICGEKQSVMQEFARGTGKECRQHIQKLNMKMRKENNTTMAVKLQNYIDFYEPIAENVENLSKEQLMLPLLVNSNNSSYYYSTNNNNNFELNCNAQETTNLRNNIYINDDNLKNINTTFISEPTQSTSYSNKYGNERNLKRHSLENSVTLCKKSKWCNYVKETNNE